MIACPDCGSTHLGFTPCGMSYRERLASVQVSEAGFLTAERHNYYDRDPIREAFGDDAKERMLEETKGLGAGIRGPDGELYRRDRASGDVVPMTDHDVDTVYLNGPEVDPASA